MKISFPKAILVLGLAGSFLLPLSACSLFHNVVPSSKDPEEQTKPIDPADPTPTDPTDPTPTDPKDPMPTDPADPTPTDPEDKAKEEYEKKFAKATADFLSYIDKLDKNRNFRYIVETDKTTKTALFENERARFESDNGLYYIDNSSSVNYKVYQENDEWYKVRSDVDVSAMITEMLDNFKNLEFSKWEDGALYGASQSEKLVITLNGKDCNMTSDNGDKLTIDSVGLISLNVPKAKEKEEQKPIDPQDNEYIYEVKNGVRKYNIPLLAKTLETAIKEGDLLTKLTYGIVKRDLIKITYFNTNNGLKFGALYKSSASKGYNEFTIDEKFLNENMNFDEAVKMFKNNDAITIGAQVGVETSSLDNDETFNTKVQNVLTKLVQDGCQGNSINNAKNGIPELSAAKVLFAYKTVDSSLNAAFDMGAQSSSSYLILAEINNKIEIIKTNVAVATSAKGNQYYIENLDTKKVLVTRLEREEIDAENAKLYEDPAAAALPNSIDYFIDERKKATA